MDNTTYWSGEEEGNISATRGSGMGGGCTCAKGMKEQIKSHKVHMYKDPGLGCVGTREGSLLINVRQRPRPNELCLRREGGRSVLPSLEVLLEQGSRGSYKNQSRNSEQSTKFFKP